MPPRQFIELSEQLFRREDCQSRLMPGVTPKVASRAVHAMIFGLLSDWLRDPDLFDPLEETRALFDAVFRGLVRDWHAAQA